MAHVFEPGVSIIADGGAANDSRKRRDESRTPVRKRGSHVEWDQGELFPMCWLHGRHPEVVEPPRRAFLQPARQSGTVDQGGDFALNWTRFSYHDLEDNQTRLPATSGFALAYNLGNPDVRRN